MISGVHELESKLIRQQQYLKEKVQLRKTLFGSVIPSDVGWSGQSIATVYHDRHKEQKCWRKHAVTSTDSGCSMGEGSVVSRRNSEAEDQGIPTIVADIGKVIRVPGPSKCRKCRRLRCEMKDVGTQHSFPPSDESAPSSPQEEPLESKTSRNQQNELLRPPPRCRTYQCRVIRDKNTYGTLLYPVYRMYLERDDNLDSLLLTARKRKKTSSSKYLISLGNDELRRNNPAIVGKLQSNLIGTRFFLSTFNTFTASEPVEVDSCLVLYDTNILGTRGPRRMKVFLPESEEVRRKRKLLERVRGGSMDGVIQLANKEPHWDHETLSHVLYFEGRVTRSSVKNFQIVKPPDESILLQFGRIGRNEFTLDYQSPFNAVQAFAIALSSFDGKIACE